MKKITSLLLALLMVISMAACGSQDAGKEPANDNGDGTTTFNNVKISAGSGTSGGGQYVYVGGISSIINTHLDGVEVILEATKGSGENLSLLQNGDLEIASIESSIAYNAMMGIDLGEGESAFPEIRCLFASLPTYFIMTTLDGSLTNCEQFAGKTFSAAVRTYGKVPNLGRGAGNRKMQHTGNTFFVPGDNGLTVCEVFAQIVRSRQTAGESGEVLA